MTDVFRFIVILTVYKVYVLKYSKLLHVVRGILGRAIQDVCLTHITRTLGVRRSALPRLNGGYRNAENIPHRAIYLSLG